jgi:hypothetical protein
MASLLAREPRGGVLVIPEPFTNAHRDQIIAQCARFKLPAVNPVSGAAERGALLTSAGRRKVPDLATAWSEFRGEQCSGVSSLC